MQKMLKLILTSRVYEAAVETPLDHAPGLSAQLNNRILLKREDLQPVFSFKLRGAYNKIAHLSESERAKGVIAASAGNHAQGVAFSARQLGIRATIVMPVTTPRIKVAAVEAFARREGAGALHGQHRHLAPLWRPDGLGALLGRGRPGALRRQGGWARPCRLGQLAGGGSALMPRKVRVLAARCGRSSERALGRRAKASAHVPRARCASPPPLLRSTLHPPPQASTAGVLRGTRWCHRGGLGVVWSEVKGEDPRSGSGGHERNTSPSAPRPLDRTTATCRQRTSTAAPTSRSAAVHPRHRAFRRNPLSPWRG